jgi:uncharacterized membrane protein
VRANRLGAQVTTLFGTPEIRPKRKYSLLPLLVVLFLISYGLMTLLIVEQSTTIESQRSTIHQLMGNTAELSALQGKAIESQAQPTQTESAQTQAPVDEAVKEAPVQTPSTQAVPSQKSGKPHSGAKARPLPERPPTPASDIADERRSLMSI